MKRIESAAAGQLITKKMLIPQSEIKFAFRAQSTNFSQNSMKIERV